MTFFGSVNANFKANVAAAARRVARQSVVQTLNGAQFVTFGGHKVNIAIGPSNLRTLLTTKTNPNVLYPHDLIPQFPVAKLLGHGAWSKVKPESLVMAGGQGQFTAAKGHQVAVKNVHGDLISASFLPQTPHEQVSVVLASKRFNGDALVEKIEDAAAKVRLSDPEFEVAHQAITSVTNSRLLALADEKFGQPKLSIDYAGKTAHVESPNGRFLFFLAQSLEISLKQQTPPPTWG